MKKYSFFFILIVCAITLLSGMNTWAQDNRPRLGLSVSALQASPILLQHLRLSEGEGLMVSNITVGGELEAAGLSQGDIVLAIDGHALSKPSDLQNYISTLPTQAQVTLDVIQKGEHRQIHLKLDNLPDTIVWKYAQPVTSPGRRGIGSAQINPGRSSLRIQPGNGSSTNQGSVAQHMTFQSIIATDSGMKRSTVTINGATDNPDSEIEITIDSDKYKTKIGDIDQLPDVPKKAAKDAIAQSGSFSFSFGSFGNDPFGGSMMEEMMKRHQEQMRMMDEFFNRGLTEPAQEPVQEEDSVLKPIQPQKNDIRS